MTILFASSTADPRMFGLHDYRRSYVLPAAVESTIPRWGSAGEPGAWNHARGVLVEVSRRLWAEPVALHYRELESGPSRLPVGIEVTAVVCTNTAERITVGSRRETAPHGPRGDLWRLTVNGVVPQGGRDRHPPSLPWLALLVHRALPFP